MRNRLLAKLLKSDVSSARIHSGTALLLLALLLCDNTFSQIRELGSAMLHQDVKMESGNIEIITTRCYTVLDGVIGILPLEAVKFLQRVEVQTSE